MFKSRVRRLNVPQYEHGRLAGILASLWGNNEFNRPVIESTAFVQGVTLHDWHYGVIDNLPIGEADEADWLVLVRQGADYWFEDPTVDVVVKYHLRRLLSNSESAEAKSLTALVETRISQRLAQAQNPRQHFDWADRITQFCDNVAFHFSFERPMEGSLPVFAKSGSFQETSLDYVIGSAGRITIAPWPFAPPSFSGLIVGYERDGYPDRLQPKVIPYCCVPG